MPLTPSSSNNQLQQSFSSIPCHSSSSSPSLPPLPPSPLTPNQSSSSYQSSLSLRSACRPTLPEECLERIFLHLNRDLSTLHSLLLVSKTFFRISMPLLYACPFDLLESNRNWTPQERTRRHAVLLYLLMNCCLNDADSDHQTDQSRLEHAISQNPRLLWTNLPPVCLNFQTAYQSLKNPLVDYLSAYHHHYLSMNIASTFPTLFPNIQRYTPLLQSYSQPTPTNSSERDLKVQQPPTHQHAASTTITMFTRNEIERAFLLHRPDLIKTMSLPIQRLPAFQSIGPKLSSLVRFELSGITWQFNLRPAIEFLQQHAQLFGTIRELRMAGPNDVKVMQKPKIHQIVKAIKHPKLFDLSRYKEASRDLNSYEIQNVGALEKLLFDLDFVPVPQSSLPSQPSAISVLNPIQSSVVTAASQSQIQGEISPGQSDNTLGLIQQCTNLSTLHIGVQSPTGFAWAVDRYKNDPRSVQQFKVLHLSSNRTAIVKQAIEDCVYAFQDSLEDLKGVSLKLSAMTTSFSNMDTTFGWSWPLNRLSVLSLKGELAVWFDFESLRYCPKLTELHLNLLPYSPPKIDHLEKVSLASQLTVLSLLGRWILTDRIIDNLAKGLQRLKTLTMDGCECNTATQFYLTPKGLTSGLDKMKQLQKLDVNLFGQIEAEMREYRVSRPELEIRIQSDATE